MTHEQEIKKREERKKYMIGFATHNVLRLTLSENSITFGICHKRSTIQQVFLNIAI